MKSNANIQDQSKILMNIHIDSYLTTTANHISWSICSLHNDWREKIKEKHQIYLIRCSELRF